MDTHEGEFGRFKIIDYLAFGRLVARWARHPKTRPATIADLKTALEPDIALVPTRYTSMKVVQAERDEFILRLPPKAMLENTLAELCEAETPPDASYDVPRFYASKLRCHDGTSPLVSSDLISDCDFFLCRIADYTVSVCR